MLRSWYMYVMWKVALAFGDVVLSIQDYYRDA